MAITDAQYSLIEDGLPTRRGKASVSNLQVLDAIHFVAKQGCKWRTPCFSAASTFRAYRRWIAIV
jgi:transposase